MSTRRLLQLVPGVQAWPPASHVPAILDVIRSELLAQRGLFIEDNKQMYAEGNRRHGGNRHWVSVSEDDPQPDPKNGQTNIHRVAHIAVKAHHHEVFRWSHRRWCSLSRPPEIPNAAQSNCESQHRRDCRQPSPTRRPRRFHAEAEPLWQQPEPQPKESRAYGQGRQRRRPSFSTRDFLSAPGPSIRHKASCCGDLLNSGESYPRYPWSFSNSAFSSAAPAAPRIVLCESTVNFQSSTPHGRRRPTVVVMPCPDSTSNRGCGRSFESTYWTGIAGALGRFRPCGTPRNSAHVSRISAASALFLNFNETDSVWPSSTATRLHCALILKGAGRIPAPFNVPRSLCVSSSIFSSSFAMYGITLPRMSSEATPGYPAPLTACMVTAITVSRPKACSSGANASTSPIAEQFGLVTTNPPDFFRHAWHSNSLM